MKEEITAIVDEEKTLTDIIFKPSGKDWAIRIANEGIFFNRERYPHLGPDDFANCFMSILENSYDVKFIKREEKELNE